MNSLIKLSTILFSAAFICSAAAYNFIYVEATIEQTRLIQISSLDSSGNGTISFQHLCDFCPDSLEYNLSLIHI